MDQHFKDCPHCAANLKRYGLENLVKSPYLGHWHLKRKAHQDRVF